ncbi:hypothetical protein ACFVVM_17025 [Nocardia sp. NPDC058176]|uniref:hypothetical protein n=1 Tax=Nocardia sp. NPDC058176 TaxID=3346368 RepID=UPI0036DD8A71
MRAPLRQTGFLSRGARGDMLTGASFAAVALGILFVVLGLAIDEPTIATLSLFLLPLGVVGLADYYAEKGERSPVVHHTDDPSTVILRYRPLRPLVTLTIFTPIAGISAIFGWFQGGLTEVTFNGIVLCLCVLFMAVILAMSRRSIRMIVSPNSLRVQMPCLDWEFDWDNVLGVNRAEMQHNDAVAIMCARAGMRRHRPDKRGAAQFKSSRRERNGPWLIPAEVFWGVPTDLLVEALICLHEDPELRARLSPALLTDLLAHGFEADVLDHGE